MRVCIVTPGALGSNPRVVKEADALSEAGHHVTVISTQTLVQIDQRDQAVLSNAVWQAQRLDFCKRGHRWRMRRALQMARSLVFSMTGAASLADRAVSPFAEPLAAAAMRTAADLYIAHYPAALPAAAIAARKHNARYAYDAEDFHLGEWPDGPEHERKRGLVRAVEGRYLAHCAYVTAASPGIAKAYADAYGIARPTVVLNAFPRSEAPAGPTAAGTAHPGPSIYWFSQTIGPHRGLEVAVQAIARAATKPHLYLRGGPAAGFTERLRAIAKDSKAADRLHVLPPESPLEMVRLASAYDIGLSSEDGSTLNNRMALGNKLFTYILAGVPALMSDIPAHRDFAAEAGSATRLYAHEDADALAAAIDAMLGDPRALAAARAATFELGQTRFNWEAEKKALLDCAAAALAERGDACRCSGRGVA